MAKADYAAIINNATSAYNSTLAGYKSQLAQQTQQQQGIIGGYNALQAGVLGGLEGQSKVAGEDIAGRYRTDAAKINSSMIARGLGNTSMVDSLQSRLTYDQSRAQGGRIADFAGRAADKTTQLGLAGLGYAGHALDANMNFAGQGLQYQGRGAFELGNLAQGFAGLENQRDMQTAAFDNHLKMQRMSQAYGAGGGGSIGPRGGSTPQGGGGGSSYMPTYGRSPQQQLPGVNMSYGGQSYAGPPQTLDFTGGEGGAPYTEGYAGGMAGVGAGGDYYLETGGYGAGGNDPWAFDGTPEGWYDL